jgi:hypothetical protein
MRSQTTQRCAASTIDRVNSKRAWRRAVTAVEHQFILVLNMNRFAPFSDNVNLWLSESSEELALIGERRVEPLEAFT